MSTGFVAADVRYSYRFDGYGEYPPNDASPSSFWLTGLGIIALSTNGSISGHHDSTVISLGGPLRILEARAFLLRGSYTLSPDNTGQASIEFVPQTTNFLNRTWNQTGLFSIIFEGAMQRPTKFWFVASPDLSGGKTPDQPEIARGEASLLI